MTRVVDLADVPTLFRASDLRRARAVDAAIGRLPTHDGRPVLEITFGYRGRPLPRRVFDHADGDLRAWWDDEDMFLTHGPFAVHVTPTAAHIGGEGNLNRAFRQVLPYVITHLLTGHERFVLHAGAVHRGGRAVLVLGGSGSGKSTLAVNALRAGWSVLGDDLVALRLGDELEVTGIAKPVVAPADVVRASGLPASPLEGDARGRWQVPIGDAEAAWLPVAATVVSTHAEDSSAELRPLTSPQFIEWLLFSFLSARQPSRLRRFLPVAAELTRRRGWVLQHGRNASFLDINELLSRIRLIEPAPSR
jgi:hypothetical protein